MRAVTAIIKKEMGVYFHSFIFYFFGFIFLFIVGDLIGLTLVNFVKGMPMGGAFSVQVLIEGMFSYFGILLLMFLPFYTMRLMAEERRQGTLELLFTSPVTGAQITLGKFLAAFLLLAGITGLPLLYPVVLSFFTRPDASFFARLDWPPVWAAYLGVLLLGGSYVAMGLFFSSLTHNQLIAAVLSIGGYLFFWLIGSAGQGSPLQPFFRYLSIGTHYEDFVRGVINTQDVIFYLSFIFLWLFLANRSIESQGWR